MVSITVGDITVRGNGTRYVALSPNSLWNIAIVCLAEATRMTLTELLLGTDYMTG